MSRPWFKKGSGFMEFYILQLVFSITFEYYFDEMCTNIWYNIEIFEGR